MGAVLITIIGIAVFGAVVIYPHLFGKIRHRTNKRASRLKQAADWLWDPLTWITQNMVEFARKAIIKIAEWGKRTRRNLPF